MTDQNRKNAIIHRLQAQGVRKATASCLEHAARALCQAALKVLACPDGACGDCLKDLEINLRVTQSELGGGRNG